MSDITVFKDIGDVITRSVGVVLSNLQSGYISGLISVSEASIILYMIVYGYMILAGKKQTPLKDLL